MTYDEEMGEERLASADRCLVDSKRGKLIKLKNVPHAKTALNNHIRAMQISSVLGPNSAKVDKFSIEQPKRKALVNRQSEFCTALSYLKLKNIKDIAIQMPKPRLASRHRIAKVLDP
jgi:hypothetical protein